jgi:hypothetical protein
VQLGSARNGPPEDTRHKFASFAAALRELFFSCSRADASAMAGRVSRFEKAPPQAGNLNAVTQVSSRTAQQENGPDPQVK